MRRLQSRTLLGVPPLPHQVALLPPVDHAHQQLNHCNMCCTETFLFNGWQSGWTAAPVWLTPSIYIVAMYKWVASQNALQSTLNASLSTESFRAVKLATEFCSGAVGCGNVVSV